MHKIILCIILIPFLTLTGCSYVNNSELLQARDHEYLTAKNIPPLSIPPGISPVAIHAEYPVSYTEYPEESKKVNLTPPELH